MSASLFPAGVNVLEHVTAATPGILYLLQERHVDGQVSVVGGQIGAFRSYCAALRGIRLAIGRLHSSYSKLCLLILIKQAAIVGHPSLEEDREV